MGKIVTEYIISIWHQVHLCVKILIMAVVLFVLLQAVEVVSLYINVNSGGLETTSGAIFLSSFWGLMGFLLLLPILILICLIVALINLDEPINILLTIVAVVIVVASFNGRFYLRNKVKREPEPDTARCVAHNMASGGALRKFGLQLNQLKNNKAPIFAEQLLELNLNLTGHINCFVKSNFVLNSNLLNKKLSQLPDNVVVIFESTVPYGKGNIGGPNDISTWWHYGIGSLMVLGDGSVEFIKTEDFNNLRWQP